MDLEGEGRENFDFYTSTCRHVTFFSDDSMERYLR
jgi:hypothetical protein